MILAALAASVAPAAGGTPFMAAPAPMVAAVAHSDNSAPVTLGENATQFILDNGIVTARIAKTTGDLEALIYRGVDRLGHDQGRASYWEQDPSAAAKVGGLTQSITIDPATDGGSRAEVSIKGITHGDPTAGLTPGSPGGARGGTINCDLEIRYTLGRGESGLYAYAIFSHPAAYGPLHVPESRFIARLNQSFDWISVDADRNLLECAPRDWGTGVVVHAKEQRILGQGLYRNSVEHKYSYTAVFFRTPAFGWSSTREGVGVWFINPTIEYLGGGASKQELVCHYGDNADPDPIILDYWRGTHYNGGAMCTVAAGEAWSKVIGPIFIYVNSLATGPAPSSADLAILAATAGNPTLPAAWTENATALWRDALRQAREENSRWPYDWVQGVDYPHKSERGRVTGQIVLVDPQAATTRLPHLTVGLAHPDPSPGAVPPTGFGRRWIGPLDWAHDAKYYQFWNEGNDDGIFTITQVRPGTYTLHAFADGVLGELAQAHVVVGAGQTVDLGRIEWKPVRYGRQLWEIGYPDRTGDKFFKGDGPNYWLWGWGLRYPLLFPQDITYTIGQSDFHRDWFFEQVPRGQSRAWLNPNAPDPANQRFGWVRAGAQGTKDPWILYGRGQATTWTVKFNLPQAVRGVAALRIALAGADTRELAVTVNGEGVGAIHPLSTNALRYNTNKSVWQEQTLKFDAARLRPGENRLQLTIPEGELTSGVVYDYLRLELAEDSRN
jgi:rhamnogalacturonan endolyase